MSKRHERALFLRPEDVVGNETDSRLMPYVSKRTGETVVKFALARERGNRVPKKVMEANMDALAAEDARKALVAQIIAKSLARKNSQTQH